MSDPVFKGFTQGTWIFLKALQANNTKAWFAAHRGRYTSDVLTPMSRLVSALSERMLAIDGAFETRPVVDKTISRIYRDIRFSKDKSPFRTTVWLSFKHARKDWKETPVYFFEISPSRYRYGLGFYCANKATMDALRQSIEKQDRLFRTAYRYVKSERALSIAGDAYKRALQPSIPPAYREWYQKKNIYAVVENHRLADVEKPGWADKLGLAFEKMQPLYRFLWSIKR